MRNVALVLLVMGMLAMSRFLVTGRVFPWGSYPPVVEVSPGTSEYAAIVAATQSDVPKPLIRPDVVRVSGEWGFAIKRLGRERLFFSVTRDLEWAALVRREPDGRAWKRVSASVGPGLSASFVRSNQDLNPRLFDPALR